MSCYYCGFAVDNCKCESPQAQVDNLGIKPANQLADEHWGFIEEIFVNEADEHLPQDEIFVKLPTVRYLYKQALIHGYKHCEQDFIKVRGMK